MEDTISNNNMVATLERTAGAAAKRERGEVNECYAP